MDGRAACRAATLVLSGAAAATAVLLLLSFVQPGRWQFGPVRSNLVLSKPHSAPHQDVSSPAAAAAAEEAASNGSPTLPSRQEAPGIQHLAPASGAPSTAADPPAPAPDIALAPSPEQAPAAPHVGSADAAGTVPAGKLAPDLAAEIEVDPNNNKFNALLIADLTAAAAEARAPVQPDAACVKAGGTVCRSVTRARALLGDRGKGTEGRLFIPMLSRGRIHICCSISNMQKQVFLDTPADLFMFSANNSAAAFAKHRCPGKSSAANVYFMAHDEHWVTPPQAGAHSTWRTHKSEGYRRMGNWRLLFQFEFAERLGYRYLWQMDDDSRLLQPMKFDLAAHMRERGLLMATKRLQHDPGSVTAGLPELTAYFLLNEDLQPQTLYQHCNPRSRDGLITQSGPAADGKPRGWDRQIMYGNCVVIDVRFWQQPTVQRYVQLIVGTGAHFRLRWQEQAVEAMVWQIFVPPGNFSLLDIKQRHPSRAC